MNLYITSGSPEFMETIKLKYKKEHMYLLHGTGNSVLIHETPAKTVFQVPSKYEVLEAYGEFSEKGYFVLQYIPLSEEGRPIFEYKYTNLTATAQNEPGCIALRVLKPIKSDTYIILTEWSGPNSYEIWAKSVSFDFTNIADRQQFFTSAPYMKTYQSILEEEAD